MGSREAPTAIRSLSRLNGILFMPAPNPEKLKRNTDTEKWKDPWFRKLKPELKSFYEYFRDTCDSAGVWIVDMEAASFNVGVEIRATEVQEAFGSKLVDLQNGKWWNPDFVKLQYDELNPDSKYHQRAIKTLESHDLLNEENAILMAIEWPLVRKGKDKERQGGGVAEGEMEWANRIYAEYPRKAAKPKAVAAIIDAIQRGANPEMLLAKTKKFATCCVGCEERFIAHPSTWFNQDRFNDEPKTWINHGNPHQRENHRNTGVAKAGIDYGEAAKRKLERQVAEAANHPPQAQGNGA